MIVTAIMATNLSYMLSHEGKCIDTCSADKKRFKKLTSEPDAVCVVGRNTFEYDFASQVLPNRTFYVMQRSDFMLDTEQLLRKIQTQHPTCKKLYVIGGVSTYNKFADVVQLLDLSIVFKRPIVNTNTNLSINQLYHVYQENILEVIVSSLQNNPPRNRTEHGWLFDSRNAECAGVYNILQLR